jgi:hypothetical protein
MNIYQKKIVKEKEFIYNEDCIQTRSTFPNSKLEKISDTHSNINIRKFYGINSNKKSKNKRNEKNNRHLRSKSQIITNEKKMDNYIPKEIKTVLIKLKTPLEQSNYNNYIVDTNYRTHYVHKFYKNKLFAMNNLNDINIDKTIEIYKSNNRENDLKKNKNKSCENINYFYNTSKSGFLKKHINDNIDKINKYTRNKCALLNNEDSMSSNNIYKKSFCLDKHKNYGGNFKNKERSRSRTNPKLLHNKTFKKKLLTKNISTPNIHSLINTEEIQNLSKGKINFKKKNIFQYLNTKVYQKNNNSRNYNDININNMSAVKKINMQYDLFINKDNKMKINPISTNNDFFKEKENNIEIEISKNNEIISPKKNKLKIKNIPPLNFTKNLQGITNNSIIDESKDKVCNDFFQYKYLINNTNTYSKINTNKHKKNIITYEEPLNDEYSMKNNNNLLNLVDISERETKKGKKKEIENLLTNYFDKIEKNKPKIKVSKNNNKNILKKRSKSKSKLVKNDSIKNLDVHNKGYNVNMHNVNIIKSIPLKLKKQNDIDIEYQNIINVPINNNKNEILSNIVFINKKDFELWNDLARIYDKNGKFK